MRTQLGDAACDADWVEGERLTLDQAVKYARSPRGSRAAR